MTIQEINQLIDEGKSLKVIAQAYSEIANQKIKKIRNVVERNRLFFEEIAYVYKLVKLKAFKKGLVLSKTKRMICVIITSNYRFYGNVNFDLIDFFVSQTKSLETDRLIIGKTALDFLQTNKVFTTFTPFILKNDQPNQGEIQSLVNIIKNYNSILVFYSKLKSLLVQQPVFVDLNASIQTEQKGNVGTDSLFLFEPELPKILDFFDSQILSLLLGETFLESEAARTASRFIAMDQADTKAGNFIKENEKLRLYELRSIKNEQILESLAARLTSKGVIS